MSAGLQPPEPVLVADLFPELLAGLLDLLSGLTQADWERPTACAGWSVKDVAAHLLGVEIGNLSQRRDAHVLGASVDGWDELVMFLNRWNEEWVRVARRISPLLLVDLLRLTGSQMNDTFCALDPHAMGGPVSWAGPQPAPVWLDLAREYTERWHHQQHLRDALERPGFADPRYLAPALAAFVRALPRAFEAVVAPQDTAVTLTITGKAGGRWSVVREQEGWTLYAGAPTHPAAEVILEADRAWRLFTRGLSAAEARTGAILQGDQALGLQVFEMVAIIA
ncbi:MAG: maleylpyruvate isomerase family mycothiol-dependent enzyme [Anaerolineales bacterium]|nr:maleylpyruvate isomerase family mycothiol-dependent enzyme [Anaerolineales bacterium]